MSITLTEQLHTLLTDLGILIANAVSLENFALTIVDPISNPLMQSIPEVVLTNQMLDSATTLGELTPIITKLTDHRKKMLGDAANSGEIDYEGLVIITTSIHHGELVARRLHAATTELNRYLEATEKAKIQ